MTNLPEEIKKQIEEKYPLFEEDKPYKEAWNISMSAFREAAQWGYGLRGKEDLEPEASNPDLAALASHSSSSNNSVEQEKQWFFTTKDGVEKFNGDKYWWICEDGDIVEFSVAKEWVTYKDYEGFSTKEAAEEWLKNNPIKPNRITERTSVVTQQTPNSSTSDGDKKILTPENNHSKGQDLPKEFSREELTAFTEWIVNNCDTGGSKQFDYVYWHEDGKTLCTTKQLVDLYINSIKIK